jgi:hypothetical protein
MNVSSAIEPAYRHMVNMLFRPFVLRKWIALGFICILAYGGGSGNFNAPSGGSGGEHKEKGKPRPTQTIVAPLSHQSPIMIASTDYHGATMTPSPDPGSWEEFVRDVSDVFTGKWMALAILALVLFFALAFLMSWLASVFHFVYIDDVARNSGAVKEPFARLKGIGTSYFWWKIAISFISLALIAILVVPSIVIPLIRHAEPNVPAIVISVLLLIPVIIVLAVIDILARDFAATAMYKKNLKIMEAWKMTLPLLRENVGQTALYFLLLIVFGMAAGIAEIIVMLGSLVAFAIPVGILALIGYLIYTAVGAAAQTTLIILGVVLGVCLAFAFGLFVSAAAQPVYVFRRAFSLIVLGQADPSLATIPTGVQIPMPAQTQQPESSGPSPQAEA